MKTAKLKLLLSSMVLVLLAVLSACTPYEPEESTTQPHEHTYAEEWAKDATHHWHAATCEHTGETAEKAEHTFTEATCTAPKTCSVCGATEGEPLLHTGGTATCTEKATCTRCNQEYGETLGHNEEASSTDTKYIKTEATCTAAAVYYKSCSRCGEKGTGTFASGEPSAHTPREAVEPKYLKTAATCTAKAVYYKSCSVCTTALTETFESGEKASHNMTKQDTAATNLKTAANCQSPAVYHYSCLACGEKDTASTFTSGNKDMSKHTEAGFVYESNANGTHTKKNACCLSVVSENEVCDGNATCENKAVCSLCHAEHGDYASHTMTGTLTESKYLKTGATCTEKAVYYHSCTACGAKGTTTFESGDALGHTGGTATCTEKAICGRCTEAYGEPLGHTVGTAATCENKAVCLRCEEEYGEPLEHEWDDATCIAPKTCSRCHETDGDPLGHAWNAGEVTTAPTCTVSGVKTFTCTRGGGCTEHKTEPVAAPGHSYDDGVLTPATCEEYAYKTYTCQNGTCGHSYEETVGDTYADHDWNQSRTCTQGRSCEVCGDEEAALGHSYDSGTVTTPATCTAKGVRTYTCQNGCGDPKTEDIPALGHDITGVTAEEVQVEGCEWKETFLCKRGSCGTKVDGETIYHHSYTSTVTKEATCQEDGEKTYTCTEAGCTAKGHTKTEPIPKSDSYHIWITGTPDANGKRTDTCACGAEKEVIVADGGNVSSGALADGGEVSLGGNISMNLDQTAGGSVQGSTSVNLSVTTKEKTDLPASVTQDQLDQIGNNPIYDFNMTKTTTEGTVPVSSFGGGFVTITLPYQLTGNENADNIAVWFIGDDGTLKSYEATYANGYITFQTNHFSIYTVTNLTDEEACVVYDHDYQDTVVLPTCTTEGYTLRVCQRCGDSTRTNVVSALGHSYADTASLAATCTTAGSVTKTCEACGDSYTEFVSATGHNYAETNRVPASCSASGSVTYACQNESCTERYTTLLSRLAHVYTPETTPATCVSGGYTTYKCATCDSSYQTGFTNPTGHSYSHEFRFDEQNPSNCTAVFFCSSCDLEESVTATVVLRQTPATCKADGSVLYTARAEFNGTLYASAKTVVLPKTDHSFSSGWSHDADSHFHVCACGEKAAVTEHDLEEYEIPASCGFAGELLSICNDCGYAEVTVIPALSHDYQTTETPATCGKDGSRVDVCQNCGDRIVEVLPATGEHNFGSGAITKPATCTEAGIKTFACICGQKYTEAIAALGHDYDTVRVEPTCGKDGSVSEVCTRCGDKTVDTLPATGEHAFVHEAVTTPATCTTAGQKTQTCDCGAKKTVELPATGHSYGTATVTKEATCVTAGEKLSTCACGDTKKETIPATGVHTYKDGACTVCGEKDPSSGTPTEPIDPPATDCDHTPISSEVIDLAKYGACGGEFTIYTCACGRKSFDPMAMESIKCKMDDEDTETPAPADPDGTQRETASATCKTCGLYAEMEESMKMDGCTVHAKAVLTMKLKGQVIVENAVYEDSFESHREIEQQKVLVSETCKTYLDVHVCKTCKKVTSFGGITSTCEGEYTESSYTDDKGVLHQIQTRTCKKCGVVNKNERYPIGTEGCYTIYRATVSFTKDGKIIYSGESTQEEANHDMVEERKESTCTEVGYVKYQCKNCNMGHGSSLPLAAHEYVNGICKNCKAEEGSAPSDEVESFRAETLRYFENEWKKLTTELNSISESHVSRYEKLLLQVREASSVEELNALHTNLVNLIAEIRNGTVEPPVSALEEQRNALRTHMGTSWNELIANGISITAAQNDQYMKLVENLDRATTEQEIIDIGAAFGLLLGEIQNGTDTPIEPPVSNLEANRQSLLDAMKLDWEKLGIEGRTPTEDQTKRYESLQKELAAASTQEELAKVKTSFYELLNEIRNGTEEPPVAPDFETARNALREAMQSCWQESILTMIVLPTDEQTERYNELMAKLEQVATTMEDLAMIEDMFDELVTDIRGNIDTPIEPPVTDKTQLYFVQIHPVMDDGLHLILQFEFYSDNTVFGSGNVINSDGSYGETYEETAAWILENGYIYIVVDGIAQYRFLVNADDSLTWDESYTGGDIPVQPPVTEKETVYTAILHDKNPAQGEIKNEYFFYSDGTMFGVMYIMNEDGEYEKKEEAYAEWLEGNGYIYILYHGMRTIRFCINEDNSLTWDDTYRGEDTEKKIVYQISIYPVIDAGTGEVDKTKRAEYIFYSDSTVTIVGYERDDTGKETQVGIQTCDWSRGEDGALYVTFMGATMFRFTVNDDKTLTWDRSFTGGTVEKTILYTVTIYPIPDNKYFFAVYTFYSDYTVEEACYEIDENGNSVLQRKDTSTWERAETTAEDPREVIYVIYMGERVARFTVNDDNILTWDESFTGGGAVTPPAVDLNALRDAILQEMANEWMMLVSKFPNMPAETTEIYEEYKALVHAAETAEELESLREEFNTVIEELKDKLADDSDRIRSVSISDGFQKSYIYVGADVEAFLAENLIGKTLYVEMSKSGTHEFVITADMVQFSGSSKEPGEIEIKIAYSSEDGLVRGAHYFYLPVLVDYSNEENLGTYDANCIYNNMPGMTATLTLYGNGFADLRMEIEEEALYQQMTYEMREGGILILQIEGVSTLFTVDEENKTLANLVPEGDVIGTYVFHREYSNGDSMHITFTVYGTYTIAGEYIATARLESPEASTTLAVYISLDLEAKTLTSEIIAGTYYFQEDGMLYCKHNWQVGYTQQPTCMQEGYKSLQCSICYESKHEPIPALGHNYDENGVCRNCGMSEGGSFENDIELRRREIMAMMQKDWSNFQNSGIAVTEEAHEEYNTLYAKVKEANSYGELESAYAAFKNFLNALGGGTVTPPACDHNYVETGRTEPTCGMDGQIIRVCDKCQLRSHEPIPATGEHVYPEGSTACSVCGYDPTVCWHEVKIEKLALTRYGACGGIIEAYTCTKCGVCTDLRVENRVCTMEETNNSYEDEAGVRHNVSVQTCTTCGLTLEKEDYTVPGENCMGVFHYSYRVSIRNAEGVVTFIRECETESPTETHDYKEVLILKDPSNCEAGYTIYERCSVCFAETEPRFMENGFHDSVRKEVDLYEFCGDVKVAYYECKHCHMITSVDEPHLSCSDSHREIEEPYYNEAGERIEIYTSSCPTCDTRLVFTVRCVPNPREEFYCDVKTYRSLAVYKNGELVREIIAESYGYDVRHTLTTEYIGIGEGDPCTGTYEKRSYCTYCDYSMTQPVYIHDSVSTTHYASDMGGCIGSSIQIGKCRRCGEIDFLSTVSSMSGCQFGEPVYESGETENSYRETYTCTECGLQYDCSVYEEVDAAGVCYRYREVIVYIGDVHFFSAVISERISDSN